MKHLFITLILSIAGTVLFSQQTLVADNLKAGGKGIEHLTTKSFKEKVFNYDTSTEWKYKGELPAIIDFYADWCKPCKMIAPILEELAEEYKGKIVIYKVDVDDEKELAGAFQTQSIPSILFIPKEGQPQMAKGALPKETFVKAINEVLKVK
ncbi:MAG: thioredoxin [Bacteroidota bacterium]|nr:thioredoxin [Bacteroidota bacterium]